MNRAIVVLLLSIANAIVSGRPFVAAKPSSLEVFAAPSPGLLATTAQANRTIAHPRGGGAENTSSDEPAPRL